MLLVAGSHTGSSSSARAGLGHRPSRHHSATFPCTSKSPNGFGSKLPTGAWLVYPSSTSAVRIVRRRARPPRRALRLDGRDAHAVVVLDRHDLAVRDDLAVDQDVGRLVRLAVELEQSARLQTAEV